MFQAANIKNLDNLQNTEQVMHSILKLINEK